MKIFAHIFLHFKLILNQKQQILLIQHKYNVFLGYITITMYNYHFLELSVKKIKISLFSILHFQNESFMDIITIQKIPFFS